VCRFGIMNNQSRVQEARKAFKTVKRKICFSHKFLITAFAIQNHESKGFIFVRRLERGI
jgi:hypothetical protein